MTAMADDIPQRIDLTKLNYKVPILASDGNIVQVSKEHIPTLIFFQTRPQQGVGLEVDVVAGIRLHNLKELKKLHTSIGDTIKAHEQREP